MCGIVGCVLKHKKAAPILLDCISKLEYRGYDSIGIATEDNKINIKKDKVAPRWAWETLSRTSTCSSILEEPASSWNFSRLWRRTHEATGTHNRAPQKRRQPGQTYFSQHRHHYGGGGVAGAIGYPFAQADYRQSDAGPPGGSRFQRDLACAKRFFLGGGLGHQLSVYVE